MSKQVEIRDGMTYEVREGEVLEFARKVAGREVMKWSPEEAAMRDERQKSYGEPIVSMTNIGVAWQAILQHSGWKGGPVPPHVVAAMMAALKMVRSVTEGAACHDDNYLDCSVYVNFSRDFHPHRSR